MPSLNAAGLWTPITSTLWGIYGRGDTNLLLAAACTGVPPTDAGLFEHGCTMVRLDSGSGNASLYENTGTTAAPVWNLVGSVAPSDIVLPNTQILVGNASNVAAAVAMSGDATVANTGAITIAAGAVTRAKQSTAAASKIQQALPATIATTSTTDAYIIVGETGTITSIDFSATSALASSDTNYITFTVTNLGQAGAGTTVILAATDANTTKTTGGSSISANTKRTLTLTAVTADRNVTAGDRLLVRAAATGTLANTVTFPVYCFRIGGTT